MSRDAALLLVLTLVGAGWLLLHFALLLRTLRASQISLPLRLLSLLPPATPIIGWLAGARGSSVLWALLGLAYGLLLRFA